MDGCKPRGLFFIRIRSKAGDKVTISGPYGEFFIKETDAEMLYIGGGLGGTNAFALVPLFHTLKIWS